MKNRQREFNVAKMADAANSVVSASWTKISFFVRSQFWVENAVISRLFFLRLFGIVRVVVVDFDDGIVGNQLRRRNAINHTCRSVNFAGFPELLFLRSHFEFQLSIYFFSGWEFLKWNLFEVLINDSSCFGDRLIPSGKMAKKWSTEISLKMAERSEASRQKSKFDRF